MADIEIKRGYEILPDNNIRFGVRVINSSDSAISDVEVILDYNESLFELEGSKIQKLGAIPPTLPRTVKFILKPLGCIHYEEIGATILYKDHTWKKNTQNMHPKEIHCVCPFLKEKPITRTEFLSLLNSGYMEERGINFENITPDKLIEFLSQTCNNRLYKVDEFSIENSKIIYLAGDALGEKAYYLFTVIIKEYEGITQVLMRANSDKIHGLNGFINEIIGNLRHLIQSVHSAREIGIIKKEQVINIIDSVVQKTTFTSGEGAESVNIEGSVVQHTEIKDNTEKRQKTHEEKQKKEKEQKEEERLKKDQKKHIAKNGGISLKKILAVLMMLGLILIVSLFLIGLMITTDSNQTPKVTPIANMTHSMPTSSPVPEGTPFTPTPTSTSIQTIWQESDIGFTIEEQNHLAIGAGRGDGIMRVYSTTNEINEYSFLNNHWEKISFGDDFLSNNGIVIGNVHNNNKGNNRVYITKYSVHEYYYDNNWLGGEVRGTSIIDEDGIVIGDVRNEDINRIYICDRDGIKELTYNYGDWSIIEINSNPYAKLTVTDGRNDGVLRLYAAINDHVYEYSWLGSDWKVEDCGFVNIYNDLHTICSGDGRNDGLNRIYITGNSKDSDGAIYELSYDGQNWQYITVSDSVTVDHMTIANARNNGINCLYTGSSKGISEYTFSGTWVKTSNIETGFEVNGLAVGNGRNDGINRIYVTGDDNHLYEYSLE